MKYLLVLSCLVLAVSPITAEAQEIPQAQAVPLIDENVVESVLTPDLHPCKVLFQYAWTFSAMAVRSQTDPQTAIDTCVRFAEVCGDWPYYQVHCIVLNEACEQAGVSLLCDR